VRRSVAILALSWALDALGGPAMSQQIPLERGLTLVSALSSPRGDRENVVRVANVTPAGVTYTWHLVQHLPSGEKRELDFDRYVRVVDLATATRFHSAFWTNDHTEFPGYTSFSLSSAVLDQLRATGNADYLIVQPAATSDDDGLSKFFATATRQTERRKGTLALIEREPEAFSLLIDGQRVTVPALHVRGAFGDASPEWRVLNDREHPLLLEAIDGEDRWRLVRVERPQRESASALAKRLELECRADLPGVYFDFGTAELSGESDVALATVSQVLIAHPDWTLAIEGHTDNVGTGTANLALSQARAAAVSARLSARYGIATMRLAAQGFGEAKPRETNDTLEGRARNRRVELVRPCAGGRR
jgi:outer membrane protein OmpA-like peptidoglycan-associated protein